MMYEGFSKGALSKAIRHAAVLAGTDAGDKRTKAHVGLIWTNIEGWMGDVKNDDDLKAKTLKYMQTYKDNQEQGASQAMATALNAGLETMDLDEFLAGSDEPAPQKSSSDTDGYEGVLLDPANQLFDPRGMTIKVWGFRANGVDIFGTKSFGEKATWQEFCKEVESLQLLPPAQYIIEQEAKKERQAYAPPSQQQPRFTNDGFNQDTGQPAHGTENQDPGSGNSLEGKRGSFIPVKYEVTWYNNAPYLGFYKTDTQKFAEFQVKGEDRIMPLLADLGIHELRGGYLDVEGEYEVHFILGRLRKNQTGEYENHYWHNDVSVVPVGELPI